jgi:N6-adenosine-specific RNA methylase IME4
MALDEIKALPVADIAADKSHLYLWVPNALLPEGLQVLQSWGFAYKSNIVWHKIRKDGGPDGRGVGFYFRNTTELVLFGVRGKDVRTLAPGRRQVNILKTMKREHSRKPDEFFDIVEKCSWGPRLEMFARGSRAGWSTWGDQADEYAPSWPTYANHSAAGAGTETNSLSSNVVELKDVRQAASLAALPTKKSLASKSQLKKSETKKFKLPLVCEPAAQLPLNGGNAVKPASEKKPKKHGKKAA